MNKNREVYLDYIRCFAFFVIVLFHYEVRLKNVIGINEVIVPIDYANFNLAELGVSSFFVLSGVCLTKFIQYDKFSIGIFYRKRFTRIYPVFYVCYFTVLVFRVLFLGVNVTPQKWTIILSLLGFDGYTNANFGITNYYMVGEWFLGAIILMYIIFPLLYKGLHEKKKITLVLLLFVYIICIIVNDLSTPNDRDVLIRLPEFFIGMMLGEINDFINIKSFSLFVLLLAVVAIVKICFIPHMLFISALGVVVYVVVGYIGKKLSGVMGKPINLINESISRLSSISFSVYLMHHVISDSVVDHCNLYVSWGRLTQIGIFLIILILDVTIGFLMDTITKKIIKILS